MSSNKHHALVRNTKHNMSSFLEDIELAINCFLGSVVSWLCFVTRNQKSQAKKAIHLDADGRKHEIMLSEPQIFIGVLPAQKI